ncbi:enoyl-ACP reductase [Lysinibacillus capsici]|uniref:enoyl-ACP reductase FabI n=1 Tax=Lysinibacillus capsici TaxID=2115968 RepID=UPI002E23A6BD|nr:enoyl-ACP reductase [Lysinibacillus capsici]
MILKGKTIVVTGVANEKSIAWGIARSLHTQGANLIFTYHKEKSLRKLKKLLNDNDIEPLCVVPCDVMYDESIEEAFLNIKKYTSKIDGIVHAIAYADIGSLNCNYVDISREQFITALNISAYSLVAICKHAKSLLIDGGSVVTQTYLGSERAIRNYSVMGVAKAALEASVRYLAVDMGGIGVRVNAISPGPILTSSASVIEGLEEQLNYMKENAPLQKNVTQEEIADTSMFLLSHLSSGITGETIYVDSGYRILG